MSGKTLDDEVTMKPQITLGRLSVVVIVMAVLVQVVAVLVAAPHFQNGNIGIVDICSTGAALGVVVYLLAFRSLKINGAVARRFLRVIAALGVALVGFLVCIVLFLNIYGS